MPVVGDGRVDGKTGPDARRGRSAGGFAVAGRGERGGCDEQPLPGAMPRRERRRADARPAQRICGSATQVSVSAGSTRVSSTCVITGRPSGPVVTTTLSVSASRIDRSTAVWSRMPISKVMPLARAAGFVTRSGWFARTHSIRATNTGSVSPEKWVARTWAVYRYSNDGVSVPVVAIEPCSTSTVNAPGSSSIDGMAAASARRRLSGLIMRMGSVVGGGRAGLARRDHVDGRRARRPRGLDERERTVELTVGPRREPRQRARFHRLARVRHNRRRR
nr:MAG TPA: hypothetical protein [Caudoviricetes sp.]